jgi:hypothetical protein
MRYLVFLTVFIWGISIPQIKARELTLLLQGENKEELRYNLSGFTMSVDIVNNPDPQCVNTVFLELKSYVDQTVMKWIADSSIKKNAKIIVYNEKQKQKVREIHLKNASVNYTGFSYDQTYVEGAPATHIIILSYEDLQITRENRSILNKK